MLLAALLLHTKHTRPLVAGVTPILYGLSANMTNAELLLG